MIQSETNNSTRFAPRSWIMSYTVKSKGLNYLAYLDQKNRIKMNNYSDFLFVNVKYWKKTSFCVSMISIFSYKQKHYILNHFAESMKLVYISLFSCLYFLRGSHIFFILHYIFFSLTIPYPTFSLTLSLFHIFSTNTNYLSPSYYSLSMPLSFEFLPSHRKH